MAVGALLPRGVHAVGSGLFSQGMKNLVDRPRPAADETLGLFGPLFTVDHGSFPSGHAVIGRGRSSSASRR